MKKLLSLLGLFITIPVMAQTFRLDLNKTVNVKGKNLTLKSFSHKRSTVNGPKKATAYIEDAEGNKYEAHLLIENNITTLQGFKLGEDEVQLQKFEYDKYVTIKVSK